MKKRISDVADRFRVKLATDKVHQRLRQMIHDQFKSGAKNLSMALSRLRQWTDELEVLSEVVDLPDDQLDEWQLEDKENAKEWFPGFTSVDLLALAKLITMVDSDPEDRENPRKWIITED